MILLPSFTFTPSYCNPVNVVWSVSSLPSFATLNLTTKQIEVNLTQANAAGIGIYPLTLTATAYGDAYISVATLASYTMTFNLVLVSVPDPPSALTRDNINTNLT